MYQYNMTYPNELYHYGVKGMKWGHRKAPTVSTKTGRNKSATNVSDSDAALKEARKAKIKKAAKIGAAVTATALVAYGAYKLNKNLNTSIANKYKEKGALLIETGRIDKFYSLKYSDLADKAKFYADKSTSKRIYESNMRSAKESAKSGERAIREGYDYLRRSKQKAYTTREKADYVKKAYKNRYNKSWLI